MKYNTRRNSDIKMNNSYKIVNDRILQLKKFEYDFANLIEIVKGFNKIILILFLLFYFSKLFIPKWNIFIILF